MKTFLLALAGLCLSVFTSMAQNPGHPVIDNVQVMYKPDKSAAVSGHAFSPEIKVNGITNVTLKSGYDATKIYLKIKDRQTQAVVYDVNYVIGSLDISNNGVVLYKKQGNVISITNPAIIGLKPYVYELYTEDAAGTKSSLYTIIQ
jgi:hypothetical protein